MYSIVLMMALSSGAETPADVDHGHVAYRGRHGCHGCYGCYGCEGCYGGRQHRRHRCHGSYCYGGCYGGHCYGGGYGCSGYACYGYDHGCHGCYGGDHGYMPSMEQRKGGREGGGILLLLPQAVRRLVLSVVIIFHFLGIATAITSVPPTPWLSSLLWAYVYRPYLEFLYMTNAYHFYSPEPGPACMIWFYVRYEDGTAQWMKIPRRQDFSLALEYQRRLSFTESVNQLLPTPAVATSKRNERLAASERGIRIHPVYADTVQYREPSAYSKRMLEAYARFAARHTPHPTKPEVKVTSVKIYRTIHFILSPAEIKRRESADDPKTYFPYYQGEFTPDGQLIDPNDPCLYWLIPIIENPDAPNEIWDYCSKHAEEGSWPNPQPKGAQQEPTPARPTEKGSR